MATEYKKVIMQNKKNGCFNFEKQLIPASTFSTVSKYQER